MKDSTAVRSPGGEDTYIWHELERLRGEKDALRRENARIATEFKRLKKELARLKNPPLIIGYVVDVFEPEQQSMMSPYAPPLPNTPAHSGRTAVIQNTNNVQFLVNVPAGLKIEPGDRVAMRGDSGAIMRVLPKGKSIYATIMEVIEKPETTYRDIGGLSMQIEEIKEVIELPLKNPGAFKKVGIEPPKGILVHGPPGTGKTLVAKAVANDSHATFIKVIGSELVQKYIGEGAKLVKDVFELAKEKSPSIIFIDEIDAIASKRIDVTTGAEREVQRTLMQLLSEMDGFDPTGDIKIIAATNRIDILDNAILRPGRFDRVLEFSLPDEEGRRVIFGIHTKRMNVKAEDGFMKKIIEETEGASGADIKMICTEAGIFAIRDERDYVEEDDFEKAIDKVLKKIMPRIANLRMYI